jgi:hypothetical protein
MNEAEEPPANNWIWPLVLLASGMSLFVAIGNPSEYGFYTLTRWAVTAAAIGNAVVLGNRNQNLFALNLTLAALFNPFIPLHLGRELWVVLDLAAPIALVGTAWRTSR